MLHGSRLKVLTSKKIHLHFLIVRQKSMKWRFQMQRLCLYIPSRKVHLIKVCTNSIYFFFSQWKRIMLHFLENVVDATGGFIHSAFTVWCSVASFKVLTMTRNRLTSFMKLSIFSPFYYFNIMLICSCDYFWDAHRNIFYEAHWFNCVKASKK